MVIFLLRMCNEYAGRFTKFFPSSSPIYTLAKKYYSDGRTFFIRLYSNLGIKLLNSYISDNFMPLFLVKNKGKIWVCIFCEFCFDIKRLTYFIFNNKFKGNILWINYNLNESVPFIFIKSLKNILINYLCNSLINSFIPLDLRYEIKLAKLYRKKLLNKAHTCQFMISEFKYDYKLKAFQYNTMISYIKLLTQKRRKYIECEGELYILKNYYITRNNPFIDTSFDNCPPHEICNIKRLHIEENISKKQTPLQIEF